MIRRVTAVVVMIAIYLFMGMTPVEASSGTLGGQLFATGGDVTVKILPADAGDTSDLYLYSPGAPRFIATNRDVGKVVNLGTFPAGVELIFGIRNQVHGDIFKMGPGTRNPDGIPHAVVDFVAQSTANVGFEDAFGGFDKDYNDNVFQFTSVASNPPPNVSQPANQAGSEGTVTSFDLGALTDPGDSGPWAVDVDWGDGSIHTTFTVTATGSLGTQPHTYADNGTYTVTVKVTDSGNAPGSNHFTTTVANVPPTVGTPSISPEPSNEGSSAIASATFSDLGSKDAPFTCTVSYGDDSGDQVGTITSNTCTGPDHTYTDDGSYTVTVKVTDKDSGTGSNSAVHEVNNVAPTANFTASSPVDEGGSISLSLTDPFDPSKADATAGFSYAFDCGDGNGYGMPGSSNIATCTALDNPSQTVKGKITDKDGGSTEYSADITVNNVAPAVGEITVQPADPMPVNTTLNASADFTDPGMRDTHTATWDWGDGTTSAGTVSESNGSGSVTDSHTYTAAGVYTVTLTVTDKDDAPGTATYQYAIVYDPNAGFVTGGGWINSPEGACQLTTDCQHATGKVNFGFVSKYHKGANVPTGNTQFQFQAGNVNFHSTSYQWLVIAGAKAQYKGEGTINGTGNYGFLLSAIDGDLHGGGTDTFRIKIWDIASGNTVYDNQMDASDTSDPTTAISGGSIVIHN